MIIARIDDDRFVELVRRHPLIAFQRLEFGYAVACPSEAYYAPMSHAGGGNLSDEFAQRLKDACLHRMSMPAYRTLRPTAKPIPSAALVEYLRSAFGESAERMSNYDKAAGDHSAVIEFACQVVILAIEENARPDLKEAMKPAKLDVISEALTLVMEHAETARDHCEVGEDKPELIRLNILQASQAMKSALEMLLRP